MISYNLPEHIKGDTFLGVRILFTGVDLTGSSAILHVKKSALSSPTLILTYGNGLTIISDTEMQIDKQIIDIQAGVYLYDLQITYSNGDIFTEVGGSWPITQDISYE